MKDRAGQVHLTVGGLMGGAGASTFLAGLFTSFPIWGLFIAAAVTVIGLYMLMAALLDWWLPWRKSSLVYVIEDARELSREIAVWVGDRRRSEPTFSFDHWDESNERQSRHSTETLIRWNELYAVRALVAYDRLIAHGADDGVSRWGGRSVFELPGNPLGMEEVGRRLGLLAAQLEMKAMTRR